MSKVQWFVVLVAAACDDNREHFLTGKATVQDPKWTADRAEAFGFNSKADANWFFIRLRNRYMRGALVLRKEAAL